MKIFLILLIALAVTSIGCGGDTNDIPIPVITSSEDFTIDSDRESLLSTYPEIPETSYLLTAGTVGESVYNQCLRRYSEKLGALKKEADSLGAKLILTVLSAEIGEAISPSTQKGAPLIMSAAGRHGITAYNFITDLSKYTPKQLTLVPLDGHWSAAGYKIIAGLYRYVLLNNSSYRSVVKFSDSIRPKRFGDLGAGLNEALDGGKNIPYQLITNKQGLRMGYDLSFPKTKQRILFLGDSHVYSPFLDNSQILTEQLQKIFPDKEIINAGVLGYTVDDCVSLLAEKAKYTEPDIIIYITNPNDIGDMYFTQRNHLGRSKKAYNPTAEEKLLYKQLYKK